MGKQIWRMALCMLLLAVIPVLSMAAEDQTTKAYDAAREGVVSGYYCVDQQKGYITGIAPGTPASTLLSVCLPAGGTASGDTLSTGTVITFPNGTAMTAIVAGDLNGDGEVSITDMLMVKSAVLGNDISETAAAAADLNFDGQVSITDFLKLKSCLLGREQISVTAAPKAQSLVLITPGSSHVWQAQGVSYLSDNEAVATVDSQGTVTAGQTPGTTFLYALDAQGTVLSRQLVTVLEEALTVSFDRSGYILTKGQSVSAAYSCNHPVMPVITWQTSDPTVVEVAGGVLTAMGTGKATVTATVYGGSPVELSVEVVTAISDWVDIGEHRYYFDENGQMYHGWLQLDGDTYYLKENGVMAIGQVTIDGINRFFTSTGKHVLMPNPWNPIPEDYTFELVSVGAVKANTECADALQQMVTAGKKAGYYMYVDNVYRSLSLQQFLWDRRVQAYMQQGYDKATAEKLTSRSVAIPGHSEHQMGLAADISKSNQSALNWLGENCWDYGFIVRYPADKTEITGIMYEPWHFRYVGVELAMELKELGICMEEYMQMLTQQEMEKEPPFTEIQ